MSERTCRKCGVTKPFTRDFFSLRRWTCNQCMRSTANKWDQDHPEKKRLVDLHIGSVQLVRTGHIIQMSCS